MRAIGAAEGIEAEAGEASGERRFGGQMSQGLHARELLPAAMFVDNMDWEVGDFAGGVLQEHWGSGGGGSP